MDETIGSLLSLSLFPQVLQFEGDAVLELVERGVSRKGYRVRRSADGADDSR